VGHRERAPRLGRAPGMWAGLWGGAVLWGDTACMQPAAAAARPRLQACQRAWGAGRPPIRGADAGPALSCAAAGAALQALQTGNAALATPAPPPNLAPQEHRCPAAQNSTSWCVPRMTTWINMMAGYLRSVDPNHMARARAGRSCFSATPPASPGQARPGSGGAVGAWHWRARARTAASRAQRARLPRRGTAVMGLPALAHPERFNRK